MRKAFLWPKDTTFRYENPLFQNIDFNGHGSVYRTGRKEPIRDYRSYWESCPIVERACRVESMWLAQNLLLGSTEDTRDIVRAFEKAYANRDELR